MDRGRVEDEDRLVEPGSDRDAVEVHRAGGERARGLGPDIPASGPGIAEGLGQGTYGSSPSALILPAALAELVGTFILVFGGTAVAVGAILSRPTAGAAYDSLAIALAFGLTLAAVVAAIGHVSGAHVNPAVTLGMAATRKFPWRSVPYYLGAQLVGAVLGALGTWLAFGGPGRVEAKLAA